MSYARTAGALTASVRELGDYEASGDGADDYISAGFLMRRVDANHRTAYELLAESDPDRVTATTTYAVTSATGSFPLPTDMYRLRAIDARVGGSWLRLQRDDPSLLSSPWELPWGTSFAGNAGVPSRYRLEGDHAFVSPDAAAGTVFRTTYIPVPTTLTGSDQPVDGTAGTDELVVWSTIRDCRAREDKTTAEADAKVAQAAARIREMGRDRDSGQPTRLEDPLRPGRRSRRWRR